MYRVIDFGGMLLVKVYILKIVSFNKYLLKECSMICSKFMIKYLYVLWILFILILKYLLVV